MTVYMTEFQLSHSIHDENLEEFQEYLDSFSEKNYNDLAKPVWTINKDFPNKGFIHITTDHDLTNNEMNYLISNLSLDASLLSDNLSDHDFAIVCDNSLNDMARERHAYIKNIETELIMVS